MEGSGVGSGGCVYSAFGCAWRVSYVVGHCKCIHVFCHAAMPTTSTPEVTSFQVPAAIIGGVMGGALILVILLLILVVIIAVVVMRRKKAAVQSFQLEVLAR